MNRRVGQILVACAALLSLPALSPEARAQDTETVFYTGPNNTISIGHFSNSCSAPGSGTPLVSESGTNLNGIAVRGDGTAGKPLCIIGANATQGGGLRMYNATTGTALGQIANFPLSSATAAALDSGESIYAVADNPGGPDELWFVPRTTTSGCSLSNYGGPILIDSQVDGANQLTDVKVVDFTLPIANAKYDPADVLVLSRSPVMLVRYKSAEVAARKSGGPEPTPTLVTTDFDGTDPVSFALAGNGEILVATNEGRILRIGRDGVRRTPDFFAFLPGSGVDIATGLQNNVEKAFVTVHQGSVVQMFGFKADKTGQCEGSVAASNPPHGVGNASFNQMGTVRTPAGTLVSVSPSSAQLVTYEVVKSQGQTSSSVFLVCGATPGSELVLPAPIGPTGRFIPPYVQPFANSNCPAATPNAYLVYLGATGGGLDFFGSEIEQHIEENQLGFDTDCADGPGTLTTAGPPRTYWATDSDDPAVVESNSFTDISTRCGSNIGRGWGFSYVLTGYDTRSPRQIASEKLTNLDLALNGTNPATGGLAPYITSNKLKKSLEKLLRDAKRAFDRGDEAGAQSKLESFLATVKANLGSFRQCVGAACRNAPGELAARANTAIYMDCGAGTANGDILGGAVAAFCNRPLLQ